MRILYIIDPGTVGGASLAFLEIVEQMKSRGHIPVVCTSSYNEFNERLNKLNIQNISIGHATVLEPVSPYKWKRPIKYPIRWVNYRYRKYRSLKAIEKKIDLTSIDLIHTNSARNDIGCYLNKKFGIPHIMHIREFADLDFECINYNSNYIDNINNYSNVIIGISKEICRYWESKGIDARKCRLLYDGVKCADIAPSKMNCDTNIRMVISSGICEAKGQHLILEAMTMLPKDILNGISIDMIGWCDPRYLNKLKDFILKHNLSKNVNFLGCVNDVHARLKHYHIGLTCSRSEGFGRVTAEYMHAGLGVIASNSGANPELITDGISGLLFENGNSSSLASCIKRFFDNRALLRSCGINARNDAQLRFTDKINADNLCKLYSEVAK